MSKDSEDSESMSAFLMQEWLHHQPGTWTDYIVNSTVHEFLKITLID